MMTLDLVKKWCRIDGEHDDDLLQELINASLPFISKLCNRLFIETRAEYEELLANDLLSDDEINNAIILSGSYSKLQSDIKIARLKIICDWYEYRGNVVEYSLNDAPNGIRKILQPYWIYNLYDDEL